MIRCFLVSVYLLNFERYTFVKGCNQLRYYATVFQDQEKMDKGTIEPLILL